jgi:hypothetical protein
MNRNRLVGFITRVFKKGPITNGMFDVFFYIKK